MDLLMYYYQDNDQFLAQEDTKTMSIQAIMYDVLVPMIK